MSIVATYIKFCSDVNIQPENVSDSMIQMILVFQRNIEYEKVFQHMFPHTFIHWETVSAARKSKAYCNANLWVTLSTYMGCRNPQTMHKHGVLQHVHKMLVESDLEVDFEHLVKIYILMHIHNTQVLNVFETYFSHTFSRDVHQQALNFFSLMCNEQFTQQNYTDCAIDLLTNCIEPDSTRMKREIELTLAQSNTLHSVFQQKNMRACIGRPKLRSKLSQAKDQIFEMDQWSSWSENIRFPNMFSTTHKKKIYFLMAQTSFDPTAYVRKVVQTPDLCETVLKFPVKQADLDILHTCITGTRIVEEPFGQLHTFRTECFKSFSLEQRQKLRLNDILHLYMASYQPTWKAIWKMIFPVLSIQIIKDVEHFVANNPINHFKVTSLLFETMDWRRVASDPDETDSASSPAQPAHHAEAEMSHLPGISPELLIPHTTEGPSQSHAATQPAAETHSDLLELQEALAHKLHHTPADGADHPCPAQSDPPTPPQQGTEDNMGL
jgi:hypothetical protein